MYIQTKYIEQQILVTKKNIYLNSKNCDQKSLVKNKKKLVSNKENFLVFIKKVISKLRYKYHFRKLYLQKLVTCMYCLNNRQFKKSYFIIYLIKEEVEKYIVSITLSAFFQAKWANNFLYYYRTPLYNLYEKWTKILKEYKIPIISFTDSSKIVYKNPKKYLTYYLFDLPKEEIQIYYWLKQNSLCELNKQENILDKIRFISITWNTYNYIVNKSVNNTKHYLKDKKLLGYILQRIKNIKSTIVFSKFISNMNYSLANTYYYLYYKLQVNSTLEFFIFYFIRYLLYKKNHQNRWKVRKELEIYKIKTILTQVLTKIHKQFNYSFSIHYLNDMNNKIDQILYTWQTRK